MWSGFDKVGVRAQIKYVYINVTLFNVTVIVLNSFNSILFLFSPSSSLLPPFPIGAQWRIQTIGGRFHSGPFLLFLSYHKNPYACNVSSLHSTGWFVEKPARPSGCWHACSVLWSTVNSSSHHRPPCRRILCSGTAAQRGEEGDLVFIFFSPQRCFK